MADPSEKRPLVSVIIVNYNGREFLLPCVRSVFRQPYRPIEVILVDNGSCDGSAEQVVGEFQDVRVIRNRGNNGFALANNQGVEAAKGEVVVLLNNDTVVTDGWIAGLLAMLQEPNVWAVTSKVVTEGVPERFYMMNGTINYLGYNIMRHFADTSQIFFAGGASLAFRREQVGLPFPEEFFLYHEDVHLSWRLRLQGHDVRMAQDSVVQHVGSVTTKRHASAFVTFYQERNRLLNALLLYEGRTLAALAPLLLVDALAKCLLALAGRGKSLPGILRAYAWPVRHWGWVQGERRRIQATRAVPDRAILRLMSPKLVEGEGAGARSVNRIATIYARLTGLAPHD